MKWLVFPWLLCGVFLNAVAQLLLKAGSGQVSKLRLSWDSVIPFGWQLASSPYLLMGLLCYVVSVVIWIGVLSRTEVSVAYPMISLGYVVNAIAAYYLFNENLSALRFSGIFLILIGVLIVARS